MVGGDSTLVLLGRNHRPDILLREGETMKVTTEEGQSIESLPHNGMIVQVVSAFGTMGQGELWYVGDTTCIDLQTGYARSRRNLLATVKILPNVTIQFQQEEE